MTLDKIDLGLISGAIILSWLGFYWVGFNRGKTYAYLEILASSFGSLKEATDKFKSK